VTSWQTLGKSSGVLPVDGGTALRVFGNPFALKVSGAESHGAVALIVATFAPGTGALPHLHRGHDECFYVLDGTFRFRVGDEYVEAGAGACCFAPRSAAHGFNNIGRSDGSLLGVIAPAGYEQHFVELSNLPPGQDTAEALAEIFKKYDQESVPPL
jgi:mannose-6-phosphate isomerase-like protein (cupin superfamily)